MTLVDDSLDFYGRVKAIRDSLRANSDTSAVGVFLRSVAGGHVVGVGIELCVRCLLVALFLPFSALDKVLNFRSATAQAAQTVHSALLARAFIVMGLGIEVLMSLAILTGWADRLAAAILAAYCIVTAVLWKRFWATNDFRLRGDSRGRDVFWDFLKNLALAGGFLLLAFGTTGASVNGFLRDPLSSSQPYRMATTP